MHACLPDYIASCMHNVSSSYFDAASLTVTLLAASFLHLWLAWGHGLAGVVWHGGMAWRACACLEHQNSAVSECGVDSCFLEWTGLHRNQFFKDIICLALMFVWGVIMVPSPRSCEWQTDRQTFWLLYPSAHALRVNNSPLGCNNEPKMGACMIYTAQGCLLTTTRCTPLGRSLISQQFSHNYSPTPP